MGKLADSAFPGIVDVVEQEEERFLIMEWIEGETLADADGTETAPLQKKR